VRKFGSYCWQTIPDKEFAQMIDGLIVDLGDQNINNEDQLAAFVSKES